MKLLSVLLFLLAMNWTWGLARHDRPISEQVHLSIQEDLKRLITDYIQENLPTAHELKFDRFWTEALSDKKIRATFIYSFRDSSDTTGSSRLQLEGYGVLNRGRETAESTEWSLDELVIQNQQVDFDEPMRLTPNDAAEPTPPTEPAEQ